MLGMLPPESKSNWKVHTYNCTQNSAMGFSPYFLMYGRQPQLPIHLTLWLTPKLIAVPTYTWYVQNWGTTLGGPTERWTYFSRRRHGTINVIMINVARQCPWGWEKWSWPVSLPSRADMKSRASGKTGSMWWRGRPIQIYQYMWYVPQTGKGIAIPSTQISCCQLAITWKRKNVSNIVEGGGSNKPTPVPYEEDALLGDQLTGSWPEGIPKSPSKQCKLVHTGLTGLTNPDSVDEGPQADDDVPAPLRWSSRKTRNQLPWRYWNFAVWQNNNLPNAFNMWVDLCICLHIMWCLYTIFRRNTVWRHSIWTMTGLPNTNHFWHWWGYHQC